MLGELDRRTLRLMRTRGHSPRVERAAKAFAAAGEYGAVWATLGLTAAALDRGRRGQWLAAAAVGPLAIGVNYAVKLAVRRPRPDLGRRLPPLGSAPSSRSFPSAHATSSFAAAATFGRVRPAAGPPAHLLATLIVATRPYLGMHYPSDVLAGVALGAVLGRLVPGLDTPAEP